jgi:O-antigen/teichoic acid export membrane protein
VAGVAPPASRRLRTTLVATLILGAAGFVSGVLVNRLLGPDGRGRLAAVQTAPTLLATVGALGMAEALVYHSTRRPQDSRAQLTTAFGIATVGSGLAIAIGWLLLPVVLAGQEAATLRYARGYLLAVPVLVAVQVIPSGLRARGDFRAWNLSRLAPGLTWTAVVLLAYVLSRPSVPFLVASHVIVLMAASAPLLLLSYRRAQGPSRPDRQCAHRLFKYGAPTAAQTLPQLMNLRLDQFLISATLPAGRLGLYAAAVNWCVGITLLMDACGYVLLPSLAAIDDSDERVRRFAQSSRLAIGTAAGLAALTALATPVMFPLLFGTAFRDAVPAALILSAANGALGYARVLGEGARGLGEPSTALLGELVGLAVTATSLAVLLPTVGIIGAAAGSLLGYSTVAVTILVRIGRRHHIPASALVAVKPSELLRALSTLGRRAQAA